jgi:uncharacterized membrane protein YeaQ/YmgE (transglycosylase-associated protein family)
MLTLLADLTMSPGGVISWIMIGLVAGWLASMTMSGGGYGIVRDIVLGLVGALIGGFIAGFFLEGQAGFWGSIVVSFLGACVLIAIARALTPGRAAR